MPDRAHLQDANLSVSAALMIVVRGGRLIIAGRERADDMQLQFADLVLLSRLATDGAAKPLSECASEVAAATGADRARLVDMAAALFQQRALVEFDGEVCVTPRPVAAGRPESVP